MCEPQLETIGEDRVFVQGDETRGGLSTREGRGKEKDRGRERELALIFLSRCERSIGEFHSCTSSSHDAPTWSRDRGKISTLDAYMVPS